MATEKNADVIVDKKALDALIEDYLWFVRAQSEEYNKETASMQAAHILISNLHQRDA